MRVEVRNQAELDAALAKHENGWGNDEIVLAADATFKLTSDVRVFANGSSQPRVVANGSSQPSVVAYDSSQPRVVAYGSSQPRVVAYGSSQPSVVANGSSQPRVEAYDSSQPRVVAKAYTQLVARGPVCVDAQPTVSVVGFGKPTITGTDRVQIVKLDTPADWCAFYGVEVVDGVATLYKAVGDNWMSPRGGNYTPGMIVEAPDWDGGINECGGGLHFSPRPTMALAFNPEAKRFVACPVALADMRSPQNTDAMPQKCKARRTCGPVYEVDRDGERVEKAEVAA